MDIKKLQEIVSTPRVIDAKYKGTDIDVSFPLYHWTNRFILLFLLGAVALAVLAFFAVIPGYTYAIIAGSICLFLFIIAKAILSPQDRKRVIEAMKTAPVSLVGLVQSSDYYGVIVFARDNVELQKDASAILTARQKLSDIGDEDPSSDPKKAYIQKRLWKTGDYFDAEELDASLVGTSGLWWRVVPTGSGVPEDFDEEEGLLLGFVDKKFKNVKSTHVNLFDESFYEHLV